MSDLPKKTSTKEPAAAITMAYGDHFFLKRWIDYYASQFGRKHLYIFSHGNDPEHRNIAEGCNVMALPRDPTGYRFDRRRWTLISNFTSGMLRYYDWLVVGDVDEVVIVDPDIAPNLPNYLQRYQDSPKPFSICPFGIEIIHNPEAEPESISEAETILSKRRVFRANANYSKPCITRRDVGFTAGGHANNHQPRFLDPHLYLLHLRFFDYERSVSRLSQLREIFSSHPADEEATRSGNSSWARSLKSFQVLSKGLAVREDVELVDFRRKMVEDAEDLHNGTVTFWGGGRTKELFRLPERFAQVF